MNIPPQASFLYNGAWSPETDTILVDTLLRLKREMGWVLKEFPIYFLITAGREIEKRFGVRFLEEELSARVQALHTRYLTFKEVVRQPGARWDFPTKSVTAPENVWQKLCTRNPFALAYYHEEEPHHRKLACLFGMDDVKVEDEKEVILLSDGSVTLSHDEPSCYEVSRAMEEVNSPVVIPPVTARRKLFAGIEEPEDRESTTELGIYFIDVTSDGHLRTRLEKDRSLPKKPSMANGEASTSVRVSHGSSCGSNSPNSWWPKLKN
ncbi:hypothetical protein SASPL_143033 [Salvia splendens]|uniref:Myb/SANT-like domain-containing protein n=2 Tax=Salvia splendens TaxID=180675 RepID=A0A8X8WLT0_SALSN|nr:hypothetical protein SASPL_143033 [Salvia splendens]